MRAFENNFVFILSAMGTILAVSGGDHQTFNDRMLELHNIERVLHDAPPLFLNEELSIKAMKKAEHWIKTNENSTSKNESFGSNFYSVRLIDSIQPVNLTAYSVFVQWYHTPRRYNYTKEPQSKDFDAFTQIVWKGTTNLGVAKLEKDGKFVVVATYSPAGNIKGQYKNNVGEKTE